MIDDLDSGQDIKRHTEALLAKASAQDVWPTPVDELVSASKLKVSQDVSPFSEAILKKAPKYLKRAVGMVKSGRINAILDRQERVVHVDPTIDNAAREKFLKLHEVGHDILPWQADLAYADDLAVLGRGTRRLFEREANQAAAELYFQGHRFSKMADQYRTGLGAVEELKRTVGSSLRATLRRYAEDHKGEVCGIYLEASPCQDDPLAYRRLEVSQSQAWLDRFAMTWPRKLEVEAFPFLQAIDAPEVGLGGDLRWPDSNFELVEIRAEAIKTGFGIALLVWMPHRQLLKRKRKLEVIAE